MALDAQTSLFQYRLIQNALSVTYAGFLAFWGKSADDSTLFSPNSSKVNVNIQLDSKLTIAKMVPRGHSSSSLGNVMDVMDEWESREMAYGLIEEEASINSTQLIDTLANEIPLVDANGTPLTREFRMRALLLKLQHHKAGKVFRTNAVLASQAILTGKHDQILGGSTDFQYDFQRPGASIVDLTSSEWNTGTPDIFGDIDDGCDYVFDTGQKMPEVMIMDPGMYSAFVKDTEVQKIVNLRRAEFVEISKTNPVPDKYMRLVRAGFQAAGWIRTPKNYTLQLFTFRGNYTDLSGTPQKFLPAGTNLIASFEGVCDRYFGPEDKMPSTPAQIQWEQQILGFSPNTPPLPNGLTNQQLDGMIFDPRSMYAGVRPIESGKAYIYRVQQAPIYAPTEIGCYYTMTDGLV